MLRSRLAHQLGMMGPIRPYEVPKEEILLDNRSNATYERTECLGTDINWKILPPPRDIYILYEQHPTINTPQRTANACNSPLRVAGVPTPPLPNATKMPHHILPEVSPYQHHPTPLQAQRQPMRHYQDQLPSQQETQVDPTPTLAPTNATQITPPPSEYRPEVFRLQKEVRKVSISLEEIKAQAKANEEFQKNI